MSTEQTASAAGTILLDDDRPENLQLLRDALVPQGHRILVATSGPAALRVAAGKEPDLILLDIVMPEMDGYETCRRLKGDERTCEIPVVFITARDEKESLLRGFAVGGVDYITKPFAAEEVQARVRTHLENSRLTRAVLRNNAELERQADELRAANLRLQEEIGRRERAEDERERADERLQLISQQEAARWGIEGFVGRSATIGRILEEIRQLQSADVASILILGESGTGKELIARAIHFGGERAGKPFIPMNCSAIPSELAESSFFGHVRGAFTGADAGRKGCFEMADGGTLFLDEVGEMPLELQAKLLRVLESGVVMPVGSQKEKEVDVHVLAATNADLPTRIAAGSFRKDLYFRLAHCTVEIPPLRERREDISLLVEHFIGVFSREMGRPSPAVDEEASALVESYAFPGNVRELKNLIESALIKSGGRTILPQHLHFLEAADETVLRIPKNGTGPRLPEIPVRPPDPEEVVRAYVTQNSRITNTECRQLLSIDRHRASYLLDKLTASGVLERSGEHRGSYYQLASRG